MPQRCWYVERHAPHLHKLEFLHGSLSNLIEIGLNQWFWRKSQNGDVYKTAD